jgi:hypothetical protein
MKKENYSIFPSKSISKIKEKKEYFRKTFENLLKNVILNKELKMKKMIKVNRIDETTKLNPPFSRKLCLSYPSWYFLPYLKLMASNIDYYDIPIEEKKALEI